MDPEQRAEGGNNPEGAYEPPGVSSPDRARFEWECRQVEAELTHSGGYELLVDARTEATWHANMYVPWDGHGDEPLERLRARWTS